MAPPCSLVHPNLPNSQNLHWKHASTQFHLSGYWISWKRCHYSNSVVTLSHLGEVTITMDDSFGVGLASPILLALCLSSVRRINMRLSGIFYVPSIPILPPSFEERLPGLSATSEVFFTFHSEINVGIGFFGLHQSQLTLSINSVVPYFFRATTFGGAPLGSVRKLRVRFWRPIRYLLSFFRCFGPWGGWPGDGAEHYKVTQPLDRLV